MLNLRLLANIINDAHIKGNKALEGTNFADAINYMRDYADYLARYDSPSYVSSHIKRLLEELSSVSHVEMFLNLKPNKQALHDKTRDLTNDFFAPSTAPVLTLPGGWANHNDDDNNHAMLYQFKMDKHGFVTLSVFNAGAGLEYHNKADTPDKSRYLAVKSFQIGHYKDIKQPHFQGFLKTLMYSKLPHLRQDDSNPEIDADTFYKQIIPQVYALNQQSQDQQSRVQAIQPPEVTTSGQLAGTCSQRALQQYIKQAFDTLGEYQRFIFHYKLYVFKDYINNALPQEQMLQAMVEQQLAHARDELLRILNLPGLFSNSDKKMLWQQIDDCYQKWLDNDKLIEGAPGLEKNSDDHHEN